MTLAELAARLDGARKVAKGYEARCPAHEDRRQSLSISTGDDGRILVRCHAGCEFPAIAKSLGLAERDFFAPRSTTEITFDYRDEAGQLLFQVVRRPPKLFTQRRPDGQGGWINKLNGVRRVPYRLPELLAAGDKTIFLVEGEKDAENLRALGLIATTTPQGADAWRDEYAAHFAGRSVVILPDADEPGRRYALRARKAIGAVAASVRVVELPGLPPKGDVSDWIAAGGTRAQLEDLAAGEREPGEDDEAPVTANLRERESLPTVRIGDVPDPGPVEWLIRDLWTLGAFGIVGALPKSWKTFLTLQISVCVALGRPLFGRHAVTKGRVLIFAAEGGKRSVRRRMGALCRAFSVDIGELDVDLIDLAVLYLDDDATAARFLETVERHKPRLVVIDPLREVHRGDENDAAYVAKLLGPLRTLQERVGCAVMITHHMGKPGAESGRRRPAEQLRGSGAIAGAIDSGIFLEPRGEGAKKRVIVSALHRDAVEPEPFAVALNVKHTPEGMTAWLDLTEEGEDDTAERVAARQFARDKIVKAVRLASAPGRELLTSKRAIGAACRMSPKVVGPTVDELLADGRLVLTDEGFKAPERGVQ